MKAPPPEEPALVDPESRTRGPLFWLSAAIGWTVIAYGIRGLLHHHVDTRPVNLAVFVLGGDLLHDLAFAPVVLLVGILVARAVPKRSRSVVQAALAISGCVALFSYPLVRNYARVLHNPSSLPHNYALNLAVVLGAVWVVAAGVLLTIALRGRSKRPIQKGHRRGHTV